MSHFLNEEDVKLVCFDYAKTRLAENEPIPDFSTRYAGKLESVLAAPKTMIGGKLVYESSSFQAAVLFYEMIKQHPFVNGNKRIACVTLLVFLVLNGYWLKTNRLELYETAKSVASSNVKDRKNVLNSISRFVEKNSRKI